METIKLNANKKCIVCGSNAPWEKEIKEGKETYSEYFCDAHMDFKKHL